jgi:GDPmannose 4,6-dehydratase
MVTGKMRGAAPTTEAASRHKRALITGINGQDGSYLAELLLEKGYEVHGVVRHVAGDGAESHLGRIAHLLEKIQLHHGSVESYLCLNDAVAGAPPEECYHLAAQSFVSYSFLDEQATLDTNLQGTLNVLAVVRRLAPACRFFLAGSSEMFGRAAEMPQRETTPFRPVSTYGISKVASYELARNYREAYGLHTNCGILFNHESPRRGVEFLTRKITSSVARIAAGKQAKLRLGDLDARRDWGHAREYVEAMWRMLQQSEPDDYVIATGTSHTVREFVELAFHYAGLHWEDHVEIDPALVQPRDRECLVGDPGKAKEKLDWQARTPFASLVHEMVDADMAAQGLGHALPAAAA